MRSRSALLSAAAMVVFPLLAFAGVVQGLRAGGGDLVFEQRVQDWGVCVQGARITVPYRLTNRGTETCRIFTSVPSCHCTSLTGLPDEVAPGDTADILVTIDTSSQSGRLEASVLLMHDGRNGPSLRLDAVGTILEGFVVSPTLWKFDVHDLSQEPLETLAALVRVQTDADFDLDDLSIRDPLDLIRAAWGETDAGGHERSLTLTLAKPWPRGPFATTVEVRSKGVARKIRVEGRVPSVMRGVPAYVRFQLSRPDSLSRRIRLQPTRGVIEALRVVRVPAGLSAAVEHMTGTVAVLVLEGAALEGASGNDTVVLEVTHGGLAGADGFPEKYRILIPVRWDRLQPYVDQ